MGWRFKAKNYQEKIQERNSPNIRKIGQTKMTVKNVEEEIKRKRKNRLLNCGSWERYRSRKCKIEKKEQKIGRKEKSD